MRPSSCFLFGVAVVVGVGVPLARVAAQKYVAPTQECYARSKTDRAEATRRCAPAFAI